MKLIYCFECQDVVRLFNVERKCQCGKSSGRYTDYLNAVISGPCVPLGFDNGSIARAFRYRDFRPHNEFTAFIIPHNCATVQHFDGNEK